MSGERRGNERRRQASEREGVEAQGTGQPWQTAGETLPAGLTKACGRLSAHLAACFTLPTWWSTLATPKRRCNSAFTWDDAEAAQQYRIERGNDARFAPSMAR
jgi:hypothetical protein